MDFDFPLILFILVVVSGLVWFADRLFFAKRRLPDQPVPAWIEYSGSFFPVLLLVFVLRSFLFEPFQIPSGSMIPTLKVGDFILVNKYAYGLRLPITGTKILPVNEPQRGEVMVFFPPEDDRYFIKRVIGLPGDEIRVVDNQLFVNGEPAEQLAVNDLPEDSRFELKDEVLGDVVHRIQKSRIPGPLGRNFSYIVPEGHYFMMGDNRDNSSDSRVWGPVPDKNIVGKAVAIWMHWESLGSLPSFDRIGKIQ
ncbi:MAG: signal peptidase I [Gammaproteobacteria bacterium]|nr:MAG: signal peptidase I [Gammaproteobacteria bacterium]